MAKIVVNFEGMQDLLGRLRVLADKTSSLQSDIERSINRLDWEVSQKNTMREQIITATQKARKMVQMTEQMKSYAGRSIHDFQAVDARCSSEHQQMTSGVEGVWKGFLALESRVANGIGQTGLHALEVLNGAGSLFVNRDTSISIAHLSPLAVSLGTPFLGVSSTLLPFILDGLLQKRLYSGTGQFPGTKKSQTIPHPQVKDRMTQNEQKSTEKNQKNGDETVTSTYPEVKRSATEYIKQIEKLEVETNPKFLPGEYTYCNVYAFEVAKAMGVALPEVNGKPMLANQMYHWFQGEEAKNQGWIEITEKEARSAANKGQPTFAVREGDVVKDKVTKQIIDYHSGSGHIATVVPYVEGMKIEEIIDGKKVSGSTGSPDQTFISQAGSTNYSYSTVNWAWTRAARGSDGNDPSPIKYYTHV